MLCSNCSKQIEPLRLDILPDTTICCTCAANGVEEKESIKGIMNYLDESTPELILLTQSQFNEVKPYTQRDGWASIGSETALE
jgi:RNA polymerase-binding transcription factor DksA